MNVDEDLDFGEWVLSRRERGNDSASASVYWLSPFVPDAAVLGNRPSGYLADGFEPMPKR